WTLTVDEIDGEPLLRGQYAKTAKASVRATITRSLIHHFMNVPPPCACGSATIGNTSVSSPRGSNAGGYRLARPPTATGRWRARGTTESDAPALNAVLSPPTYARAWPPADRRGGVPVHHDRRSRNNVRRLGRRRRAATLPAT